MLAKYFILTVVGTYFFLLELENERNIKSYAQDFAFPRYVVGGRRLGRERE